LSIYPYLLFRSEIESEGYVLVKKKGIWHPYCSKDWSKDIGQGICEHLNFISLNNLETLDIFEYYGKRNLELEVGNSDGIEPDNNRVQIMIADDDVNVNESNVKIIDSNSDLEGNMDEEDDEEFNVLGNEWWNCKIGYLKCSL